jgi:hypothetical protein
MTTALLPRADNFRLMLSLVSLSARVLNTQNKTLLQRMYDFIVLREM